MKKTRYTTTTISSSRYVTRDPHDLIKGIQLFFKRFSAHSTGNDDGIGSTSSKKNKKIKNLIPVALLLLIVGAFIIVSGKALQSSAKETTSDQRAAIPGPKASINLNKEFSFPLNDAKGKELTRIKYTIESAELRDEIIVKGSRAVSVKGRTFLILNIKLVNTYDKGIDLNARDYVRLVANNNETELIAADIHNDPVNIQPISTKSTRLGFPINDTDKNLMLKVGEIKGAKETVALSF